MIKQDVESYVNDLARNLHLDSGNLTRKLLELEKEGILKSRWQGKQRYYSLNLKFPLISEYKTIVLKTVGFEQILRNALKEVPGIKSAIIFGSYAQDQMDAHSDIDLLVIGNHGTVELQKSIAQVQKKVQREINVISMSSQEHAKKKKDDPLLKSVYAKKTIKIL